MALISELFKRSQPIVDIGELSFTEETSQVTSTEREGFLEVLISEPFIGG